MMTYFWWYLASVIVAMLCAKAYNKNHIPYDHVPLFGVIIWPLTIIVMIVGAINDWMHE